MGPTLIVVDANVLIYNLVENERSALARRLREKDSDWRFPILWRYEFGNALNLMVRQKKLAAKTATQVLETAQNAFSVGEAAVDAGLAFHLAIQHQLTFYDAQYLALAQAFGVPLVTEDKALRRAGTGTAVSLEEFLN